MKMLCTVIGIVLLVIAGIYFVTPADTLPSFFPGHEAGVMRVHMKHGIVFWRRRHCVFRARLVVRKALRTRRNALLIGAPGLLP